MEKFDLPEDDYIFEENVRKINKTDRVHADVVNPILSALFKNSIWGKRNYVTKKQLGIPEGQNPSVENQVPTIPKEPIDRENISDGDNIGTIFSKVKKFFKELKTVAFTGEYKDLLGKPSIPTVPGSIKNPFSIKVNGKSYDGSTTVDVGTIGIGYGGTGATSAAVARVNLGAADTAHLHDDRYYTETETNNLLNTKAASSHKHSTTDITSGVFPIARGGTGATDAAGARANLGAADSTHLHDDRYYTETETNNLLNTKAASSHNHSTADITSGVFPIARGGTGATNAAGARTNLGLGAAAMCGVANNCTTNVSGFALDAQQGKNLKGQLDELNSNLEECFQSVSSGKSIVASAITGKGVQTASDATFQAMANNVNKISTGYILKSQNQTGANGKVERSISYTMQNEKCLVFIGVGFLPNASGPYGVRVSRGSVVTLYNHTSTPPWVSESSNYCAAYLVTANLGTVVTAYGGNSSLETRISASFFE